MVDHYKEEGSGDGSPGWPSLSQGWVATHGVQAEGVGWAPGWHRLLQGPSYPTALRFMGFSSLVSGITGLSQRSCFGNIFKFFKHSDEWKPLTSLDPTVSNIASNLLSFRLMGVS